MGRVAKRERAKPAMSPAPEPEASSSPAPAAKSRRTEQPDENTPKRVESKKFVPDLSELDNTDAASVHSDESVRVENSQEKEDALVTVGSDLTGDALKDFLQTNFVDFVDDKLFDIPNLDSLDV